MTNSKVVELRIASPTMILTNQAEAFIHDRIQAHPDTVSRSGAPAFLAEKRQRSRKKSGLQEAAFFVTFVNR